MPQLRAGSSEGGQITALSAKDFTSPCRCVVFPPHPSADSYQWHSVDSHSSGIGRRNGRKTCLRRVPLAGRTGTRKARHALRMKTMEPNCQESFNAYARCALFGTGGGGDGHPSRLSLPACMVIRRLPSTSHHRPMRKQPTRAVERGQQ